MRGTMNRYVQALYLSAGFGDFLYRKKKLYGVKIWN